MSGINSISNVNVYAAGIGSAKKTSKNKGLFSKTTCSASIKTASKSNTSTNNTLKNSANTVLASTSNGKISSKSELREHIRELSKNTANNATYSAASGIRGSKSNVNNNIGMNSILADSKSYVDSLRTQRQQKSSTTSSIKKLKYQFKSISSRIIRSKTSMAARQAAGAARREVTRLNREKMSSKDNGEELEAAIAHAKSMERVAKKKAKHLAEEEMVKIQGGPCAGAEVDKENAKEANANDRIANEKYESEYATEYISEYASNYASEYASGDYESSIYENMSMEELVSEYMSSDMMYGLTMDEMEDFSSEFIDEMAQAFEEMLEDTGLQELADSMMAVDKDMDPADFKMMKIKHRNSEMKEIVKADARYLKAIFDQLNKMQSAAKMPISTHNTGSTAGGISGVSSTRDVSIGMTLGTTDISPNSTSDMGSVASIDVSI